MTSWVCRRRAAPPPDSQSPCTCARDHLPDSHPTLRSEAPRYHRPTCEGGFTHCESADSRTSRASDSEYPTCCTTVAHDGQHHPEDAGQLLHHVMGLTPRQVMWTPTTTTCCQCRATLRLLSDPTAFDCVRLPQVRLRVDVTAPSVVRTEAPGTRVGPLPMVIGGPVRAHTGGHAMWLRLELLG